MLARRHIKAPKSFDPGRGHPTEHLAYLNPAEMEMLRRMTDGTVSRGPKNIPSFAVTTGKTTTQPSLGSSTPSGSGPWSGGSVSVSPNKTANPINASNNSGSSGPSSSPKSSTSQASATAAKSSSAPKAPSAPTAPKSSTTMAAAKPSSAPKPPAPVGGGSGSRAAATLGQPYTKPAAPVSSFSPPPQRSSTFGQASGQSKSQNVAKPSTAASAMTDPQKQAYSQFGKLMSEAPRLPQVPRAPGDAERMARMAMAESGLIRDKDTGKMNLAGAQGVMNVIRNRMLNQDKTVGEIINQKSQFSPWGDGKYSLTKPDPAYTKLAESVLRGEVGDITKGADFYHNTDTVTGGYSTASNATKDRINNNFIKTFEVNDGVKPGVYGHQFGIAADGSLAAPVRPSPQRVRPGGIVDPRDPARPVTGLPSGIFGQDTDNIGRVPLASGNSLRVPGRFGGMRPNIDGKAEPIAYKPGQPVDTQGAMTASGSVPITFANQPGRVSKGKPDGIKPAVLSAWQQTLDAFGKSVPIVSGHRDAVTNAAAGGAKKSQHLSGNAIDVDVRNMSIPDRQRLISSAMQAGFTGVGVYNNSLHFDMGNRRAWGPSKHADSVPSWAKSVLGRSVGTATASAAATPAAPQRQAVAWGLPGAMQKAGEFLANPPAIDLRSGLDAAGRAIKSYADTEGGTGFQRAAANTYIKSFVAPKVRDAFTGGLSYVQSLLRPSAPQAAPSGPYQGTYPYTGGSPATPPAQTAVGSRFPTGSSNFGAANTIDTPEARTAVAQALAAADAPVPIVPPPVTGYQQLTPEQRALVLRKLLGEEWYA